MLELHAVVHVRAELLFGLCHLVEIRSYKLTCDVAAWCSWSFRTLCLAMGSLQSCGSQDDPVSIFGCFLCTILLQYSQRYNDAVSQLRRQSESGGSSLFDGLFLFLLLGRLFRNNLNYWRYACIFPLHTCTPFKLILFALRVTYVHS